MKKFFNVCTLVLSEAKGNATKVIERNGGSESRQSFKLGEFGDCLQLQSNTMRMGVVEDPFLTGW